MNTIVIFAVILSFIPCAYMSTFVVLNTPSCNEYNPTYFNNFTLALNKDKLNLDMDLTKPLHAGLRVHMDLFSRKVNSKTFQSFYQYSIDMCSMLAKRRSNIFKRWFATFFAYGNFKKRCPAPPNHYYLRDYKISELDIPSFLYAGFYRLTFNMIQGKNQSKTKDFVIRCTVEVEIK